MKKCRNDYKEDLRTALQWSKVGKLPNDINDGKLLWANHNCQRQKYRYYLSEEVHDATKKELDKFLEPYRIKRREYQKEWRKRKKEEQEKQKKRNEVVELLNFALAKPIVKVENETGGIVLDVETTGLDSYEDEILQLSIIDLNGNVLFSSYIKPYWTKEWEEAERINRISKEMVENAPYIYEILPQIRGIISSAELIVGYNVYFDIDFLLELGILGIHELSKKDTYDVMRAFAPIYGEYNEYYENYKWKSLSTCANYFNYEFKAHDSLEDVKATLHCYNAIYQNSLKKTI